MPAGTTQTTTTPTQEHDKTDMDPRLADFLRRAFWWLNRFMILMWRLGLGIWLNDARTSGQIMIITHTGRKSGLRRQTPVNYAIVDGELYCTSGFGRIADWYRNIRVQPKVEIWLPHGRWMGEVDDITASPNYTYLMRQVLIGSGFAARLAGINPHTISDEDLIAVSRGYRLLHIRRTTAATGPGGPGDLAWFWPLTTAFLLFLIWRPFRRLRDRSTNPRRFHRQGKPPRQSKNEG